MGPTLLALFAAVGLGAGLWAARAVARRQVARRLLRGAPSPIGTLREDALVRVEGRVAIDGTPLLRSPIEGRPCVGYYVGVDYFDATRHQVPCWFPITEETVVVPFRVIGDDGAVVEVDADRFDVEVHFVESGRVLDPPPERVVPVLSRSERRFVRGRNLAYVEVAIAPGARVSIVGRVLRPAGGGAGAYRRSPRGAALGPLREGDPIRLELAPEPDAETVPGLG
ncbi:MAG: hypothetical protein KF729_06135 [Sandaracinaceae bacterium]|nr:hypothetical protein [Sandaracinaceae bacterium]